MTMSFPIFSEGEDSEEEIENSLPRIFNTVAQAAASKEFYYNGGTAGERQRNKPPTMLGIFNDIEFETIIENQQFFSENSSKENSDDENERDQNTNSENSQLTTRLKSKRNSIEVKPKLFVCEDFLKQNCSLTTCPLAHPGIRDSAIHFFKSSGKRGDDGEKVYSFILNFSFFL
jgi:hypothetical protein